jgi:hypothetical protein
MPLGGADIGISSSKFWPQPATPLGRADVGVSSAATLVKALLFTNQHSHMYTQSRLN